MSSFNVFGFFALAGGNRVATQPAGGQYEIHHNYYNTTLHTTSDDQTPPPATLRVYSAAGDTPLPDNTIAFVVAKAFAPPGKPIELDALFLAPVPGDPNGANYDAHVPDVPAFIYGVGHIPANQPTQVFNDGGKMFALSLADYVGGTVKNSTIHCVYPGTRRWANTPTPRGQSCTQVLGTCNGFADSAQLQINLDHITLSLGPHTLSQAASTTNTTSPATPATPASRKKYKT
ncbi:hypothetical protein C8F04DRAFT_1294312, partial [Mycena alexandri]